MLLPRMAVQGLPCTRALGRAEQGPGVWCLCWWGFFQFVLCRKCPEESESQEDFWRMQPLWLRDLYRPLSATRKKNMAQKLHDESSDEEIFSRVVRAPRDGAADVVLTIEPEEPDEESETAPGSDAV
ncbi:Leucine-rich repeat-containing protein 37A [Camelus dromedarius]|uniref:Leucine-rich repeat-containing protein 37A n=1 Tax=Camelus dromedarius TaxID=9838 RepID=A0A5N4D471_CAMDR|nr:Leucine-rich repeat-containing protein 37A [Camelus dromedarius]